MLWITKASIKASTLDIRCLKTLKIVVTELLTQALNDVYGKAIQLIFLGQTENLRGSIPI